jgi:hypothetical protein
MLLGDKDAWPQQSAPAPPPSILQSFGERLRQIASHGPCLGYLLQKHHETMNALLTPQFRKKLAANPETCAYLI